MGKTEFQDDENHGREREKKVKKDIIAAITFIVTGLLFYAVQTDGKALELFSSGLECEMVTPVQVGETAPEIAPAEILELGITRDS